MAGGNSSQLGGYADIGNNNLMARVSTVFRGNKCLGDNNLMSRVSTVFRENKCLRDNILMAREPAPPRVSYAQNVKEKLIRELFGEDK